jgi:hypothetical protein
MSRKHIVLFALGASAATILAAQEIGHDERTVQVRYQDGSVERYAVNYTAHFESNIWETGKPSTMFHPIDDRQCHWTARGYIQRDACLTSHSGTPFCNGNWKRIYDRPVVNRGGGWSISNGMHPENCGMARDRANQEIDDARQQTLADMPSVVEADRDALRHDLAQDGTIVDLQEVQ